MLVVTTHGQPLRIAVDGKAGAPWLVFSNSLATDLHLWDPQVEALAHAWRILRYDFRGHGKSPPSIDARCDPNVLASDLLAIMDAAGAGEVHHVGVSMGAVAGLAAVQRCPGRFRSVVIGNARLRAAPQAAADLERRARLALTEGMQALAGPTLEKWFGRARLPLPASARSKLARMIAATQAKDFAAYARGMGNYDFECTVRGLRMAALLLVGSDDGETSRQIMMLGKRQGFPALALIDGAGHLPNVQAPNEFNRLLSGFLTRSGGAMH